MVFLFKFAFPDAYYGPVFLLKSCRHDCVVLSIILPFGVPKVCVCARGNVTAVVPVPKASVYEYDDSLFGEYKVGLTN